MTQPGLSTSARARIFAAREHIHAETCPAPLDKDPHTASQCVLGVSPAAIAAALDLLDARPRDAKGARVVLHDAVCASGCTGDAAQDHANRTQSDTAASLRRFRAQESLTA